MTRLSLALSLVLLLGLVACEDAAPPDVSGLEAVANCVYENPFSGLEECREYLGADWDEARAEDDCNGQDGSVFVAGEGCAYDAPHGACVLDAGTDDVYQIVIPGDGSTCESSKRGCEVFGGGTFVAAEACGGLPDEKIDQGKLSDVFVQSEQQCVQPLDGQPGQGADGKVCTWQDIGACTEEGRDFVDYGRCDIVRSQRPYAPVPASDFVTPDDDPIWTDASYQAELAWVTDQVESCGCVCCHSDAAPSGPSNWYIEQEGIWTDGFWPTGLAIAAGWVDSSLLGARPAHDNNGFGRDRSGIPSTDQDRMIAFFEGELSRRGFVRDDFEGATPIPEIFYEQIIYEPSACENGEGVRRDGTIQWSGGPARYLHVLERDATNPGVPPNLDEPEGTLWMIEVPWTAEPFESGLVYGEVTGDVSQRVPTSAPPALVEGREYLLYVQKDVMLPITRCLFTY
jgi:hypothetical protein